MWPSKIKAIAGISVILLFLATVLWFSGNQQYLLAISVLSSLVQIILFIFSYFEENPQIPERTINQVEAVYNYAQDERAKNSKKEEFIKRLLREGVIDEQELRTALSKIQNEDIILVHTYGEGTPENLKKELGMKSSPAMTLLIKLGFVRVFSQHNLFLIPIKDLPPSLRSVKGMENFLNSELEKIWLQLRRVSEEKYPAKDYKIMEKWRSGEGCKVTYIISRVPKNEIIAGFKNRYSFTPEFVAVIYRQVTLNQTLPPVRNVVKVKELVTNTSIELLLSDFPIELKEKIISNEKTFKESLRINLITELRNTPIAILAAKLHELDPARADNDELARNLIDSSKEFYDLLVSIGVTNL